MLFFNSFDSLSIISTVSSKPKYLPKSPIERFQSNKHVQTHTLWIEIIITVSYEQ